MWTNNTERMSILSGGNVGIGTSSPTRRLQIGNFSSTSTATPETFSLGATYSNSAGNNPKIRVWEDGTYSMGFGVSNDQLDYILGRTIYRHVFYAEGNHLMTILGTGNVGIGITSPGQKLHIEGGSLLVNAGIGASTFNDVNIGGINGWSTNEAHRINFVYGSAASPTIFQTIESLFDGSNSKMRFRNFFNASNPQTSILMTLQSNGNLGIGTDSPTDKIHMYGSAADQFLKLENTSTYTGMWLQDGGVNNGWLVLSGYTDTTSPGDFAIREYGVQTSLTIKQTSGNVGIGTATPGAKLTTYVGSGAISGTNDGLRLQVSSYNTSARNTIAWHQDNSDLNLGRFGLEWNSSTSQMNFVWRDMYNGGAGSTELMRLQANGNLGIGTDAPLSKLHVNGDIRASLSNVGQSNVVAYNTTTGLFTYFATSSISSLPGGSDGQVQYNNGGVFGGASDLFYDDSTGNVGVGTAAPTRQLDVYENSTVQIVAQFANSSSVSSRIKFADLNTGAENVNIGAIGTRMAMWTNNTERMSIVSGGNVGIGTTNPTFRFVVNKATQAAPAIMVGGALFGGPRIQTYDLVADPNAWMGLGTDMSGAPYEHNLYYTDTGTYGRLSIGTYSGSVSPVYSEKAVFNRVGNLGINTTAPGYKLDVTGDINFSSTLKYGGVNVIHNASTDVYANIRVIRNESTVLQDGMYIGYNNSGGSSGHLRFYANGTTERMRIDASTGNVGISTDNPSQKLQVAGNIALGSTLNGYLEVGSKYIGTAYTTPGADGYVGFQFESVNAPAPYNGNYSQNIKFYTHHYAAGTGGTPRMTIQYDGNIGIGTLAPGSRLDITKEDGGQQIFRVRNYATSATGNFTGNYAAEIRSAWTTGATGGALLVHTQEADNTRPTMAVSDSNGVFTTFVNGNVGIGQTNPVYKLGVVTSGTLGFRLQTSNSTVGGPMIDLYDAGRTQETVISSTDGTTVGTYIASYSNHPLMFSTNAGASKMILTTGGDVGIGITTPGAQLVVGTQSSGTAGSGVAQDNSVIARFGASNAGARVTGATIANTAAATVGNDATLSFIVAGNYSATGLISAILQNTGTASTDMAFSVYNTTGNFERMRITAVGNVGIGITNPSAILHINGQIINSTNLYSTGVAGLGLDGNRLGFNESGVRSWSIGASSGVLNFYSGDGTGTFNFNGGKIQNTGVQVGGSILGSNTAAIFGATNPVSMVFNNPIVAFNSYYNSGWVRYSSGFYSGYLNMDPSTGTFEFVTDSNTTGTPSYTTRLTILQGGNVGIGTATPLSKLHVNGDIRASLSNVNQANAVMYNTSTGLFTYVSTGSIVIGTATNADNVYINEDATAADQPVLFAQNTSAYYPVRGNKTQFTYNPSTNTLTAGTYIETSALKFKENIEHLTGSLHQVEQLQGVSYNRIGQSCKEIGFIADEVVKILPELVKYQDGEVYGLSYNRVTAVLVEAVKELSDKVNQQEIFIQDLTNRLKKLEDKG